MKKLQRLAAFALVLVMLLAAVPFGVSAADTQEPTSQKLTQEELEIVEKNLNQKADTLSTSEPMAAPDSIPTFNKRATYNSILPSTTMVNMTTVVGQTMDLQLVLFCYGASN